MATLDCAVIATLTGCAKIRQFCHSERSEESLFLFKRIRTGEILRFAQNDKRFWDFYRSLFMQVSAASGYYSPLFRAFLVVQLQCEDELLASVKAGYGSSGRGHAFALGVNFIIDV